MLASVDGFDLGSLPDARPALELFRIDGAVLDAENRAFLRGRGRVVYLRASVNQQLARTRRSENRPLLMTPDPRDTLEQLMQLRAPLYEDVADIIVDPDGRKVRSVVDEIVKALAVGTTG